MVQTLVQTADISLLDYVTSLLSDHLHFDLPSLLFSKTRARQSHPSEMYIQHFNLQLKTLPWIESQDPLKGNAFLCTHSLNSQGFHSQPQTKQDTQNSSLFEREVIYFLFLANMHSSFDLRVEVIRSRRKLAPSMCSYGSLYLPVFIQHFANVPGLSINFLILFHFPHQHLVHTVYFISLVAPVASSVPAQSKFSGTSYGTDE